MPMLHDAGIEPLANMRETHGKPGSLSAAKTIIPPDVPGLFTIYHARDPAITGSSFYNHGKFNFVT